MMLRGIWRLPLALLAAGLPVAAQATISATPGVLNYMEGDVSINGRALSRHAVGSTDLGRNQVLATDTGKAEILLTPGAFLRVGDHSSVRMVSPSLTDTRMELQQGEALVEVTQLYKGNQIRILDNGTSTELLKAGLYRFEANPPGVSVFDGKALVVKDDSTLKLGKGHQTSLAGPLQAQKFDRKAEDPLYQWSSVRSQYLADASLGSARTIIVNRTPWIGPGWYWNPWWGMYSYLPGDGFLYSPFGWGFYSPAFLYGTRYFYAPVRRVPGRVIVPPPARTVRPAPNVRSGMGGMRPGGAGAGGGMMRGGGSTGARRR